VDWGHLYCHIIACTGWTWEYIDDHMTIPRLLLMNDYWQQSPPLHTMVAAYFGIGKDKEPESDLSEISKFIPVQEQVIRYE